MPLGFRREFSEPEHRATQFKKKEIKNHLKLYKASDEKLARGITSTGRHGLSRYSFFEARQDRNRAGREVTPNDESNATSS